MRCAVLSVPLNSEVDWERKMNEFLAERNVKHVFASLANQPGGLAWSALFFYEDEEPVTQAICPFPGASTGARSPLGGEEVRPMIALKKWRAVQAAQEGVPLYMAERRMVRA